MSFPEFLSLNNVDLLDFNDGSFLTSSTLVWLSNGAFEGVAEMY
jgi:hypothetical protein